MVLSDDVERVPVRDDERDAVHEYEPLVAVGGAVRASCSCGWVAELDPAAEEAHARWRWHRDRHTAPVPVQQEPEGCAHPKESRSYTSKGVWCGRCNELIEPSGVCNCRACAREKTARWRADPANKAKYLAYNAEWKKRKRIKDQEVA